MALRVVGGGSPGWCPPVGLLRVDGVRGSPAFVFERLAWREAALQTLARPPVCLSHPSMSIR